MRFPFLRTTLVTVALIALGAPFDPAHGAGSAWRRLDAPHAKTTRAALGRILKRDGVAHPQRLLNHRYLVRVELTGAGGGTALHSEVVIRFRSLPKRVLAKAWNPGGPQPGRAQLGPFEACKTRPGSVGRTCREKYNGKGFVDVTRAFTHRNMLFVHDPRHKGKGHTVLWFAADRSQHYMWFYIVPKAGWPSFGKARVRVRKYLLPTPTRPVPLPTTPSDPGSPRPGGGHGVPPARPGARATVPAPRPRAATAPTPRRAVRAGPETWTTVSTFHQPISRARLAARLRTDGLRHPGYLLDQKYLVRIALVNAGGGSLSRSELQLRLLSQPIKALAKAWADLRGLKRGQIGAEDRCRPLPSGRGGPEAKRCPMQLGGLGWRNVLGAFSSVRMRLVVDPNNNNQGNMVLWLGSSSPQTGLRYRFAHRAALPSLGRGEVQVNLFELRESAGAGSPGPRATPPTDHGRKPLPGGAGWTRLGSWAHRPTRREVLATRMRRDGVAYPQHLLRHKYLVRLSITRAGGTYGRRSEVEVRMDSTPKAALGVAWSDHRQRWGAQLGPVARCRTLPAARNPYGGADRSRPRGHVCPIQYGGLGWRNLVSAFTATHVMIITAPGRPKRGNQLIWLAFDRPQPNLAVRPVRGQGANLWARVRAEKLVIGHPAGQEPNADGGGQTPGPRRPGTSPDQAPPTWKPVPGAPGGAPSSPGPGATGWRTQRSAHLQVARNALYWTIRRDGFANPWYLLKHHYLVRLEVFARDRRAETRIRLAAPPRLAVGEGRAASRSGVQIGPTRRCRRGAGQPAFCPLHYANLKWRNLASGLAATDLLVVTDPGGYGRRARTVIWLAFDRPQPSLEYQPIRTAAGQAALRVQRYRY